MKIAGNTILITGGGSGIGAALAKALQAAGNTVIIAGRRKSALEAVVSGNPGMSYVAADVETQAGVTALAQEVTKAHPALNVLINNAGIMRPEDLLAEPFDLADAEATIATNLLGPIRLIAALLPHLRRQASATIINVTSGLAFVPLAATPTYNATKAAMHSYSQSLRFQLRDTPVQVIELAPPAVATELMPGHDTNPNSMPLDAFISETVGLLEANPDAHENAVARVKFLRNAEASGNYKAVFGMLNGAH